MNLNLNAGVWGLILIAALLASAGSATAVTHRQQFCGVDGSGYADAPGGTSSGYYCWWTECNTKFEALNWESLPVCEHDGQYMKNFCFAVVGPYCVLPPQGN